MKIAGRPASARATKQVTLDRPAGGGAEPIVVTIQALPLGFEETILERIPMPRPPRSYAMKGGKVLKGADGRPVIEEDERDAGYLARLRRAIFLQSVAFVHEALRADRSITWEAAEPKAAATEKAPDWEAFYQAIYDEMRTANFTSGDLRRLGDEALVLSNVKEGDLAAAREHFLPAGPATAEEAPAATT